MTALTQIPDIDIKILNYLSDRDLANVCLVNRYILSLCQSEPFWLDRVEHFFPGVAKFRSTSTSLKEHYFNLRRILAVSFPADEAIKLGYTSIGLYEWLSQRRFVPTSETLAKQGDLNFLEWALQKGIAPDIKIISEAASTEGGLHILEWMEQRGIFPDIGFHYSDLFNFKQNKLKYNLEYAAALALANNFKDMVAWFEQRGIQPEPSALTSLAAYKGNLGFLKTLSEPNFEVAAEKAAKGGQIYILEYLKDQIKFDSDVINAAVMEGQLETAIWLSQWILPNWRGLRIAATKGNLEMIKFFIREPSPLADLLFCESKLNILKYLVKIGVRPKEDLTQLAAQNGIETTFYLLSLGYRFSKDYSFLATLYGQLDALRWAIEEAHLPRPSQEAIDRAAKHGHVNVLRWLSAVPSPEGILDAITNGQGGIVKWVIESGIYLPRIFWANAAAKYGQVAILEYLGIFPDKEGINEAIVCDQIRVIIWLVHKGINATVEWADLALMNSSLNILTWLSFQGIFPSSKAVARSNGVSRLWLQYKGKL